MHLIISRTPPLSPSFLVPVRLSSPFVFVACVLLGCSLVGAKPNYRTLCVWRDDVGEWQLSQYYSMPICTPARAALMTGRYSIRYGFQYSLIQPGAAWGLPLTEKVPKLIARH